MANQGAYIYVTVSADLLEYIYAHQFAEWLAHDLRLRVSRKLELDVLNEVRVIWAVQPDIYAHGFEVKPQMIVKIEFVADGKDKQKTIALLLLEDILWYITNEAGGKDYVPRGTTFDLLVCPVSGWFAHGSVIGLS